MVDADNAKSKREFKKLSKHMGDKLDKEKGRSVSIFVPSTSTLIRFASGVSKSCKLRILNATILVIYFASAQPRKNAAVRLVRMQNPVQSIACSSHSALIPQPLAYRLPPLRNQT